MFKFYSGPPCLGRPLRTRPLAVYMFRLQIYVSFVTKSIPYV